VRIDDEHDLHDHLAAAFEAISPHPVPIDDAMRGGRTIRTRRRVAVAVGVAAVAAAAVFSVPVLLHRTAAPAPASPAQQYTVTVQVPGRGSPPGVIALGTINGQRWWIIADRAGADFTHPGQQDIVITGPAAGGPAGSDQYIPPLSTAGGLGPVSFTAIASGPNQIQVGAVQADVSYVTVRLGNGTVLVLHPVTVYGTRAVAFAAPIRAEITEVTAYSRHGEIAFAVPFNWPGGTASVISWLRPGQVRAPRISGVIGSGTVHGQAWSATAYLGPWGTCIGLDGGAAPGGLCVPDVPAVTVVDTCNPGRTPQIAGGIVAASVTRVAVTEPDGTTVQVRPVTIDGQKLFAIALRPGQKPLRWVAYDGTGKIVASSGR
jgi:hypothetical protein